MTTNASDHQDKPREEIIRMAEEAIGRFSKQGNEATIYFKFTCPNCGERCTFIDPNTLWEEGECHHCGKTNKVERAGFSLHLR